MLMTYSAGPESSGDQLREEFWLGPEIHLGSIVRSVPALIIMVIINNNNNNNN